MFTGIELNKFHLLVEGAGQAEIIQPVGGTFETPEHASAKEEERVRRPGVTNSILLPTRQLFPQLRYRDLATGRTKVGASSGKPTLLLLWHPSCAMCFEELTMFAQEEEKLKGLGIEILATTAEPGVGENPDEASRVISESGFPFPAGFTAGEVIERMLVLHRHLFYSPYHLGVPTSFLLDKDGRLAAVYRGEIELSDVTTHLKALSIPDEELLAKVLPFEGTWFEHPYGPEPSVLIKEYVENQMPDEAERTFTFQIQDDSVSGQTSKVMATIAQSYLLLQDFPNARRLFLEVVERDASDAKSRNSLAALLLKEGNATDAKRLWREACELEEDFSSPRFNLGKQLMKEQKTAEAMALFRQYWALEPDDPDAHNYLSMGYLRARQFTNAEVHLRRLVELRPNDGNAYANLARVYLALRNVPAAREIITRGLQAEGLDPGSRQTLSQLGEKL